ncbi:MAG: hypothetical protein PVF05_08990 [Gemmatimonadales bacterium]|jgi:hypothetical protein
MLRNIRRALPILALAAVSLAPGCGSTEDPGVGFDARRGRITVVTTTTGDLLPSDPYVVEASDVPFESDRPKPTMEIEPNGEATFSNLLAPSVWTVTISAIPARCSLSGDASREVAVGAGRTTTIDYAVTCGP